MKQGPDFRPNIMAHRRKNKRSATKTSNQGQTERSQKSTSDESSHARIRRVSLGVVSVIAIGLVAFLAFQNRQREIPAATARGAAPIIAATYVGATSCKNCHEAAYNAWRGSQHELAMQQANEH